MTQQIGEEQIRHNAFNFYLQEIGYESHQFWVQKMKELLIRYPEYANNFAYIYYNQPDQIPTPESSQKDPHESKEETPEEWVNMDEEIKDIVKLDEFMELTKKYEDLSIDYDHLLDDFESLEDQRNTLEKNYKNTLKNFENKKNNFKEEKKELEKEIDELRNEINFFVNQRDELIEKNDTLTKKIKSVEEENESIKNVVKTIRESNKKIKKEYETTVSKLKSDLKTLEKAKKEYDENKCCNEMIISNKNKLIEDKEKYVEKLKARLQSEFQKNVKTNEEYGYTKGMLKKMLANLDNYNLRLEAEGVDTAMVQLIQEIMEMKRIGSLQISPLYDFCGNNIYVFHNKSAFEDKKNIRIPTDTLLLSTKGFIYMYSVTVQGLVPLFTQEGMVVHIPNAKELFTIESAKDYIMDKDKISV